MSVSLTSTTTETQNEEIGKFIPYSISLLLFNMSLPLDVFLKPHFQCIIPVWFLAAS